ARPADRLGQRARRPRRDVDGSARPARPAQPAQRAHRPPLPGRPTRARRRRLPRRRGRAPLGVPGAAEPTALRAAAAGYQPLPSRLTPVGTVGGVSFVDDSLAPNVLPTLA